MPDSEEEKDYQESISGFKITGDWSSIVEHGERISYVLKQIEIKNEHQKSLDEYNEWRPKTVEDSSDISKKTANSASIDTDNKDPKDEINKAKEKASDSVSDISDKDPKDAYNDSTESAKHTASAIKSITKEKFKKSEEMVYENIMTKISPYYFDNQLISANISKKSENIFTFEININVDEIKKEVSDNLQGVYDDIDRKNITKSLDSTKIDTINEETTEKHTAAELNSDESDVNPE